VFYIVYKTTNIVNGKIYVGIHKQEDEIFDGYLGSGVVLSDAILKYGEANFIRETLFVYHSLEEARQKEKEIVNEDFCKRTDTYNISIGSTGGNTLAGYSEEQKILIQEKRHVTNIERGNYNYTGEKLKRASERMKTARIQPENKNRIHTSKALENLRESYKKRTGKYIWITTGIETKLHEISSPIPHNWYPGRGSDVPKCTEHTTETRRKISSAILGDICYNNGVKNLKLKIGETPPEGYSLGMIQNHGNKKWITNGLISRKISQFDAVPEGWSYGKKFKKQEEIKTNE